MKVSFDFDVPLERLNDQEFVKTLSQFLLVLGGGSVSNKALKNVTTNKPSEETTEGVPTSTTSEGKGKKRGRKPKPKQPNVLPFIPDSGAIEPLFDILQGDAKKLMQVLQAQGTLSVSEACRLLNTEDRRHVGGTIGSVRRWSQQRGFYPPYIGEKDQNGQKIWRWVGTAFLPSFEGEKTKAPTADSSQQLDTEQPTALLSPTADGPKKRGRPRKVQLPPAGSTETPKKSGRGRPRKTAQTPSTESAESSALPKKERRGRPRKDPNAPKASSKKPAKAKKMGRPKQNESLRDMGAVLQDFNIVIPTENAQEAPASSGETSVALITVTSKSGKKVLKKKAGNKGTSTAPKKGALGKKITKPLRKTALNKKTSTQENQAPGTEQKARTVAVNKPRGKKTASP